MYLYVGVFYNRPKPTLTQPWIEDAAYFDGTGYAEITPKPGCSNARFDLDVKLVSQNGILLLFRNEVRHLHLIIDNTITNPTVKYCYVTHDFPQFHRPSLHVWQCSGGV